MRSCASSRPSRRRPRRGRRGELDEHAAAVGRVREALDQSARGQPVDPVRHRAGGDQGFLQQLAGGQLVRRSGPAKGREYVELPGLQAVGLERLAAGAVQVPGQPADPGQHLHRRHVEVGRPGARPRAADRPRLPCFETTSSRLLTSRQLAGLEYLDIKIIVREVVHAHVTGLESRAVRHVRRRGGRPFADLVCRIRADDVRTVVDLGCGPGKLTVTLRESGRRRPSAGSTLTADDRGGGAVRR